MTHATAADHNGFDNPMYIVLSTPGLNCIVCRLPVEAGRYTTIMIATTARHQPTMFPNCKEKYVSISHTSRYAFLAYPMKKYKYIQGFVHGQNVHVLTLLF